jgi:hypothetical protein
MIGTVSIAAATAVVGYDLFGNTRWNVSSKRRTIRAIAIAGSAAINDCIVDVYVEDKYIGQFFNTRAGVVAPLNEDVIPLGRVFVPPGSKISCIVADAPATNPIIVRLY